MSNGIASTNSVPPPSRTFSGHARVRVLFPSGVIVKRELLTALRRRRSVLYVVITVLPCMGLLCTFWPRQGLDMIQGQAQVTTMTQEFLGWYAITLLGICGLLTPAFAAASVSYERDMDTLDLIRTTMISRTGIVLAKLFSSAGLFLLIAIASAPMVGSLFFATGLDRGQLASLGATILLTTLTWGLVGLACASRVRNFVIALALTYAIVFLLSGLPELIVASILTNWRRGLIEYVTSAAYQQRVFWLFPPVVLVGLVVDQFSWASYGVFLVGQAWTAFLASFRAARAVGREREERKTRTERPIDDPEVLAARRQRFPYYIIDPLRRTEPIGDHANPMRVRELRWGLLGMRTRMIRTMYASMAVFMLLGIIAYGADGVYLWFILAMVFCALVGPPFLMPIFSRDLRRDTLDGLRSTLLRPEQVILGRYAAGLATMLPLVTGIFAASLILLGANLYFSERVGNFFTGYATLAVCIVLVVAICLLVSQFARRTATAFTMAYGVIALLYGVLWLGGLYGSKWTLAATTTPVYSPQPGLGVIPASYYEKLEFHAQAWQFLSPLGAYGAVSGETYYVEQPPRRDSNTRMARASWQFGWRGYDSYLWHLPGPLLMWFASLTGFVLLAWAFVRASIWRFSKVGVRDP